MARHARSSRGALVCVLTLLVSLVSDAGRAATSSAEETATYWREQHARLVALESGETPDTSVLELLGLSSFSRDALSNRTAVLDNRVRALEARRNELETELETLAMQDAEDPAGAPSDEALADKPFAPSRDEGQSATAPVESAVPETPSTEAGPRAARRERLKAELTLVALQLEVLELQSMRLRTFGERMQAQPDRIRFALRELGLPAQDVRRGVASLEQLLPKLDTLIAQLTELQSRAAAGGLTGLRVRLDEVGATAEAELERARSMSGRMKARAQELADLALALEERGTSLRELIFRQWLSQTAGSRIDEEFRNEMVDLRRLRKQSTGVTTSAEVSELQTREIEFKTAPAQLQTAGEARDELDSRQRALDAAERSAAKLVAAEVDWRLARTRLAMTVLEGHASAEARDAAYAFSNELVEDATAEFIVLGQRARLWLVSRTKDAKQVLHDSDAWLAFAWRALLLLLLIGTATFAYSRAPRWVARLIVRKLAQLPFLRAQVGTVVRWAGLAQAISPVLVVGGAVVLARELLPDAIEIEFLVVTFGWFWWYWLGREALMGATRRISMGRPALINADPETVTRLRTSYNRIGLVLALGAVVAEQSRVLLGHGRLYNLTATLVVIWVLGWLLVFNFQWRRSVAALLLRRYERESLAARAGEWMGSTVAGSLLVPFALGGVLGHEILKIVRSLLTSRGVFAYLQARKLKKQTGADADVAPGNLPDSYTRQFPLYPVLGESDAVLLQRKELVDPAVAQIQRWRETRKENSLVIVGEQGSGKTTQLAMVQQRITELPVIHCTWRRRMLTGDDIAESIARAIESDERSIETLTASLLAGPERVILVDDAHYAFLRVVDGYDGFDALVHLVNSTTENICWILVFNDLAWDFVNASRGRHAYFRRVQRLPRWTTEELRDLLGRRNAKTGFELEFDEQLLDEERAGAQEIRLIEGSDGYFRLLWEASGGNPRVATHLWLQSLRLAGESKLRVGLFRAMADVVLARASDDIFFALASIAQHENLTEPELALTLNVGPGFSHFAIRYLLDYRLIEAKKATTDEEPRYAIAASAFRSVVRSLERRHLLYREASA